MANPSTLYALPVAVGAKDGTDLDNAAAIDPADANDIWSVVAANGAAAAGGTTIKLCADSPVTVTATASITQDGAAGNWFHVVGRNEADTADAQMVLDADGGAFSVFTCTAADYWAFARITARNTNKAASNCGWNIANSGSRMHWDDCISDETYVGWLFNSGANYHVLHRCLAHDNVYGIYCWSTTNGVRLVDCEVYHNTNQGVFRAALVAGSLIYDNGGEGLEENAVAIRSHLVGNSGNGISTRTSEPSLIADCLVAYNGGFGIEAATGRLTIINLAHYLNTSGAINGSGYTEENTIALTADPFVDAAGGNFALNAKPGGGMQCRGIVHTLPSGLSVCRGDVGAVQHGDLESGGLYYHGPVAAPLGR